ncbi:MAG: hypothetical protein FJW23_01415 [Acidimicrobiia bacterium]|nr:hypothetical protein [Acidimicrobiia bacterium]
MTRRLLGIALLAGLTGVWSLLPPPARQLGSVPPPLGSPVHGVFHVHTDRSDGGGSIDDVAEAAARAGLQFVVVTDHGDGTRPPEPPAYRSGALVIDAVEISTNQGHLVALGLGEAPYRLGGDGRDVVEDVHRLGGFAVAAHPDSARRSLRWSAWDQPIDALEWLNGDSEWRDEPRSQIARLALTYLLRSPESLGRVLDRPDATLARWDALTAARRIVAVAGSDAHARLRLVGEGAQASRTDALALRVPGYEAVFRAFSIGLQGTVLSGDAAADSAAVLGALTAGRVYSVIDAAATPGALRFEASSGNLTAAAGDALPIDGPVRLQVRIHAPSTARIVLVQDGRRLEPVAGTWLDRVVEAVPAVYRVEVELPGAPGQPPVPWMLSNPIYVGREDPSGQAEPRASAEQSGAVTPLGADIAEWAIEHSEGSDAALDEGRGLSGGVQAQIRYAISGAESSHPYAAAAVPLPDGLAGFARLRFRIGADRPMRVSVQLRVPASETGERWQRSVYVADVTRDVSIDLDDLRPFKDTSEQLPPLDLVRDLLFVVDTVNTASGSSGLFWIEGLGGEVRSGP